MDSFRYVMSPRKGDDFSMLSQTGMAIKEHVKLAFKPNLAQLFIGSYLSSITQLDNEWVEVNIYNETSRNSLFLHVPKSTDKPNIFGTISQTFKLILPLADFK